MEKEKVYWGEFTFRTVLLIVFLMLLMAGCAGKDRKESENAGYGENRSVKKEDAPFYERSTSSFQLAEDANPYRVEFEQEGFFYYGMGLAVSTEDDVEPALEYLFYYQDYEKEEPQFLCALKEGYVLDFSCVMRGGRRILSVLMTGESARILEFDGTGKMTGELTLDDRFRQQEALTLFLACSEGYVITQGDRVFFLDGDGQVTGELTLEGQVQELFFTPGEEICAAIYRESGSGLRLFRLDDQKGKAESVPGPWEEGELPVEVMKLFALEDGFAAVYPDLLTFFRKGEEKALVDLERQGILASQIRGLYQSGGELRLVLMDPYDQERKVYLYRLSERDETEGEVIGSGAEKDRAGGKERERYALDGRRILLVAIPKNCFINVEFHAKKYNQSSDRVMVQVERYGEALEDYLGKGNRPDVIMFQDQTELPDYVEKNLLADLLPFFREEDTYSLEDVIPKAREVLGMNGTEGMFAMAGRFRLLVYPSDGTEFDASGSCDAVGYLRWYDNYLTENEIEGIGQPENVLYEAICDFYDEERAAADFTSEAFMELLRTYREVTQRHKGSLKEENYVKKEIARGPMWRASYRCTALAAPGVRLCGLPGADGTERVVIRFYFPMSIMMTSDCQEEAFDFIMYYNSLGELLQVGWPEGDYGKSGSTEGSFSVYRHLLDEQIFEWEGAFFSFIQRDAEGKPVSTIPYELTTEQKDQLRHLIDTAVPETRTQRVIYEMLLEEADAYLSGAKDLQSVCEILQNRATLYLRELR